ncbi:aminoalkylphosphonic acid N-acetyltransferase [compost metagenome]
MRSRMKAIEENASYYTFVASLDAQVIGMIGVRLVNYYEADGIHAQISCLVTKQHYQGQGVGKQLIRFVESWAKEKGTDGLSLTSGIKEDRVDAHEFYKKMGFKINGYRFVKKIQGVINIFYDNPVAKQRYTIKRCPRIEDIFLFLSGLGV